jgi:hypothetical protein
MLATRAAPCLLAALLGGCTSDKVSWEFVSSPDGSFPEAGGGLIVVVRRTSLAADDPRRWIQVDGEDRRGPVRVRLLTEGDTVLLEYPDRIEVREPRLPDGEWLARPDEVDVVDAGPIAFTVALPAAVALHPAAQGPGRLVAAAFGSLLVLEHRDGLVVFGDEPDPRILASHQLHVAAAGFLAVAPDRTARLLRAPDPTPSEDRLQRDAGRGSVTIRGPFGERLAELREEAVHLSDGADGLLFRAEFPTGLGRRDPGPFVLLGPRNNRYVLRVDG